MSFSSVRSLPNVSETEADTWLNGICISMKREEDRIESIIFGIHVNGAENSGSNRFGASDYAVLPGIAETLRET